MAIVPNWAVRADEMFERYGNANMTYEGRTMPIDAWCKELAIMRTTFFTRLWKFHRGDMDLCKVFARNRLFDKEFF